MIAMLFENQIFWLVFLFPHQKTVTQSFGLESIKLHPKNITCKRLYVCKEVLGHDNLFRIISEHKKCRLSLANLMLIQILILCEGMSLPKKRIGNNKLLMWTASSNPN